MRSSDVSSAIEIQRVFPVERNLARVGFAARFGELHGPLLMHSTILLTELTRL